ncbi:DpnI domain-containing protein [Neisseria perflava]|uniref:DpnI domain-containing protein n=1 Tax=Neisseria perflava TaxID=33053 RepID=UPI00209EDE60|nr:DpnI domain-containing protein [Neisseria perflava]MCP1660504.1 putative RNA-binding Zn-ribbon protein involved in translation (DUF1610 family) [Neisseria perflava]
MMLNFDSTSVSRYHNARQTIRELTENWLGANGYCPNCGCAPITKFENNRPVADFFCHACGEQFELKSKAGLSNGKKVPDGAYHTMITRIQADDSPNFFFLAYKKADYSVQQLILVPKHFITTGMIIPRKQALQGRPNYLMCDMDISSLPQSGRIYLIHQAQIVDPETVCRQWQANLFLRQQNVEKKGWLLAIMRCIDTLPDSFHLAQLYEFEAQLKRKFPENNHIKDKIRQQLQILRDQNIIEFTACGQYRKITG